MQCQAGGVHSTIFFPNEPNYWDFVGLSSSSVKGKRFQGSNHCGRDVALFYSIHMVWDVVVHEEVKMQGLLLVCSSKEIAKAVMTGAASWIISLLPNVMFQHSQDGTLPFLWL